VHYDNNNHNINNKFVVEVGVVLVVPVVVVVALVLSSQICEWQPYSNRTTLARCQGRQNFQKDQLILKESR
jgi:hypothetical protein